jgi:hypothetical protein
MPRPQQKGSRLPARRESPKPRSAKAVPGLVRQLPRAIWIFLKWLFGSLLGWMVLLATLLGFLALVPNVAVQAPNEAVDPINPFHASFSITNNSNISIFAVGASCTDPGIEGRLPGSEAPTPQHPLTLDTSSKLSDFYTNKMSSQQSATFACESFTGLTFNGVRIPVDSCSVTIKISTKILYLIPWHTYFKFIGEIREDGKIHWHAPALLEDRKGP